MIQVHGDLPNHLGFLPFQDANREKSIEKNLAEGFFCARFEQLCSSRLSVFHSQNPVTGTPGRKELWEMQYLAQIPLSLFDMVCWGLAMKPRWSQTHGIPHASVPKVVRLQTCTTTP